MKEKDGQTRILNSAKLSFKGEGAIKIFLDLKKSESVTCMASVQEILKGIL